MKTSKRKVTRLEFSNSLSVASLVINTHHPRTKLAYYCQQYMDINKALSKEHNKLSKRITKKLENELANFRVDNAVEKDGIMLTENVPDGKGNIRIMYKFNKKGERAVKEKEADISEKIEDAVDNFLAEEIEVKCIISELKLPENIKPDIEHMLNGFVFKHKNEHEETMEEETEEEQTA